MPPKSKQANRRKSTQAEDEPVAVQTGSFVDLAKSLLLGSMLAKIAPQVPQLVKDGIANVKGQKVAEKKNEEGEPKSEEDKENDGKTNEVKENDEKTQEAAPDVVVESATFRQLCAHLHWSSPLGLAAPVSGEASLKAWKDMKGLELDFGPKKAKWVRTPSDKHWMKDYPGLERINANLQVNVVQYLHALLLYMVMHAGYRSWCGSWFPSPGAFLPWLIIFQFLSVFLPLDGPVEKCPVEFRIVGTIFLNALVQFFFLYELLWETYFYEKIPLVGMIAFHAYAWKNHSLPTR